MGQRTSTPPTSICAPTSVDHQGWATYGSLKMPDYRWGIFLADQKEDRQIGFGDLRGEKAWSRLPGEHRVGPCAGDRDARRHEPASVEQQRLLGHVCPSALPRRMRPINVIGATCGHGYLLHVARPRRARPLQPNTSSTENAAHSVKTALQ